MRTTLSRAERIATMTLLLLFNWPTTLMVGLTAMVLCVLAGGYISVAMLLYVGAILFLDKGPERAGRRWLEWAKPYARSFFAYRFIAKYFPISLVKTADLPAKPHMFVMHPHGVLGMGAFINFATDATGFAEKFPTCDMRMLTLKGNLLVPFHREWALALGVGVASERCINHCLSSGKSVGLVVGGAAESLRAKPGVIELVLKKRRGFVRLAIKHGVSLVPVLSFGENDVFKQVDYKQGSLLSRVQQRIKDTLSFALPLVYGRGFLEPHFGIMPFRRPIVSVVGKPVPVERAEEPTREQIDEVHARYVAALHKLFDEHKDEHCATEMHIVE